jgi:hypothetical protein
MKMSEITFGEVEWGSAAVSGGGNRASDFMQLEQGDNKGRVLSNPQQFAVHWVVDETGKKRKVNCATTGCPVCLRGGDTDKPQARWLIKFLSRKDGAVKLLEITSQVVKGVQGLVQDPDWGQITDYDINIKRAAPGAQPLYSVVPSRRVPLTAEEKSALTEFSGRVDVARFITPPTPAVVSEKLGWTVGAGKPKTSAVSSAFETSGAQVAKKAPAVDFDFDS